ncbi:unnamed protein product [Bursaphelenchus okinawaensis]|uniref:Innexin n=1 Tax=Bursaphelenchus okinawaensis TaxID=465554 RepID=A0A811JRP9_9BILA|nr:unnamed protein product [Bursaphelenchus okinawaensis]CAG9080519.1 unnamed protein product [Bursaphelenchus okinawaensis]
MDDDFDLLKVNRTKPFVETYTTWFKLTLRYGFVIVFVAIWYRGYGGFNCSVDYPNICHGATIYQKSSQNTLERVNISIYGYEYKPLLYMTLVFLFFDFIEDGIAKVLANKSHRFVHFFNKLLTSQDLVYFLEVYGKTYKPSFCNARWPFHLLLSVFVMTSYVAALAVTSYSFTRRWNYDQLGVVYKWFISGSEASGFFDSKVRCISTLLVVNHHHQCIYMDVEFTVILYQFLLIACFLGIILSLSSTLYLLYLIIKSCFGKAFFLGITDPEAKTILSSDHFNWLSMDLRYIVYNLDVHSQEVVIQTCRDLVEKRTVDNTQDECTKVLLGIV